MGVLLLFQAASSEETLVVKLGVILLQAGGKQANRLLYCTDSGAGIGVEALWRTLLQRQSDAKLMLKEACQSTVVSA
jgi:hypothetical protein